MTASRNAADQIDDTTRLENQLAAVLSLVLDMQKFGEAKLALLLTSAAGVGVGVVALFHSGSPPTGVWCAYLVWLGLLDAMAGIVALTGLVPRTTLPVARQTAAAGETNVLFFEHIQRYSRKAYLIALSAALGMPREKFSKIEEDYSAQIVRNAQVTSRKFASFRRGMWLLVYALVTPLGGIAVSIWHHASDEKHDAGLVSERD